MIRGLLMRGPRGLPGPQGAAGPVGTKGDAGPQGSAGPAGAKGDTGPQGAIGPAGAQGPKGDTGATGPKGDAGATGAQGAKGDTGATGPQGPAGPTGATGPQGPAGSNASATPLGNATPQPLGTASAGSSTSAARDDHVHPLPSGRLALVGTVTVGETTLVALALGVKRYTVTMAGLTVGDRIIAMLTGAPGPSSLQDVYVSAANTLNVGLLNPALGIGSVIAVPIVVYRVT